MELGKNENLVLVQWSWKGWYASPGELRLETCRCIRLREEIKPIPRPFLASMQMRYDESVKENPG
jgi:hypothetical protein